MSGEYRACPLEQRTECVAGAVETWAAFFVADVQIVWWGQPSDRFTRPKYLGRTGLLVFVKETLPETRLGCTIFTVTSTKLLECFAHQVESLSILPTVGGLGEARSPHREPHIKSKCCALLSIVHTPGIKYPKEHLGCVFLCDVSCLANAKRSDAADKRASTGPFR